MTFGARLYRTKQARGPLCVGIDPHASLLREWGLDDNVAGLEQFARIAVEALAPEASLIKPQSAFFERFGSRGIAVLEQVCDDARAAGAMVLLDVKRGDIGSTSQAYADAYFGATSTLAVDAITVSPYLGFGSIQPMIDTALANNAGLFVLAMTSNPEGPQFQMARTGSGRTVAGTVLDSLAAANAGCVPLGSLGAVVGATLADTGEDFAFNGPILAPGVGAQGGTPADVRRIFGSAASNVLPSSSRDILRAGPDVAALREAARRVNGEFAEALG
ncbi:orotidine-5'-phosphate decarboxylase [Nocardioides dubius]|uniref:Orotidine 5'-phosphate decarboxylase n=1 Tax=Nocardioides dubius TaxID=317019 RepID=A0ABN1TPQ3_9ACTN